VIIVRVERRKKFGKPNEIALHCWLQYMLLDRGNMYKLRKAAVDYSASLFDIISFLLKLTCYEFCISACHRRMGAITDLVDLKDT
jgi:hypothetical protein